MKCNVIRDLLPLYFDGLCSDETRAQLEEHIEHCEECRKLKQNLEPEQAAPFENQEWDKSIAPLKKVKKKIHRKNILITLCIVFILLLSGVTAILTYGQIAKKGYSFELFYDALRFGRIGKQFAAGNIEPLYEVLSNDYKLQDAESGLIQLAYPDSETYDKDMKEAILEKYHQYFDGKHLTYKGIEEIRYLESPAMGWNRTLYLSLKFEGEGRLEYYLGFYKTLNGQYLVDDFFGNPYLEYTGTEETGDSGAEKTEPFHTEDTLFSCLPNRLKDFDFVMMRQMVLVSGQRALQGDTVLADNGQMRIGIVSEQDLADGTDCLREEINTKLEEKGYYLTDITLSAKEYDKTRRLYRYQVNLELTDKTGKDEMMVTLDCYRVSDRFVYISGTEKIFRNSQ